MDTLKIPEEWMDEDLTGNDCHFAYEQGWYDGRDWECDNVDVLDNFGEWLKATKEGRGLSYRQMHDLLGVTKETLSNYIQHNGTPHIALAKDIIEGLGYELCIRKKE